MHPLRPYQKDVLDKIIHHFKTSQEHIVADLTVAFGKTLLIAYLAKHVISKGGRVLSMAHTQELIEGAAKTFGYKECSVYCAGLDRKELHKDMIYASGQSLVNNIKNLPKIDLLVIDECQFLSDKNPKTVYMKIVNHILEENPKCRILGLSGTPFRLEKGKINLMVGKKRLFKKVIATVYIKDLLELGYLTQPITPHTHVNGYDFSKLTLKMGKFQDKELNAATSDERLTKTIIRNAVDLCANRKKVLIFASTLQHASEIQTYLQEYGETCGYLDGALSSYDREKVLYQFNKGIIKFLVNKNILSVGYDEPAIDAVIVLRPSESRALIIQCIGRSLRLHESKANSLILDYAKNFESLDDLLSNEDVRSINYGDKEKSQEVIICPDCGSLCGANDHKCKACGFYFISKTCDECGTQQSISNRYCINKECLMELIDPNMSLTLTSSGKEVYVSRVINHSASSHFKNKKCLRIDYMADDVTNNYPNITQFIAEGSGLLKHWVNQHMIPFYQGEVDREQFYTNVDLILRYSKVYFKFDEIITYKKNGKFFNIVERN